MKYAIYHNDRLVGIHKFLFCDKKTIERRMRELFGLRYARNVEITKW